MAPSAVDNWEGIKKKSFGLFYTVTEFYLDDNSTPTILNKYKI